MEKHATLDKVIQDLHDKTYKTYVNFPILDHECHQEHLLELAEHIRHWRTIVPRLGFGPNVVEDLDHTRQNEQGNRQEMLSFWKCANGSRATYRNLATAFLKDKQRNLAEKVVKLSNKPPNEGKYVSCSLFCTVLNLHPFLLQPLLLDVPSKAIVPAPNRNSQQQQGNYICHIPLMECMEGTRKVNRAMQECNFERAQALQGSSFLRNNNNQLNSSRLSFSAEIFCGCSSAISSFVSGFGCSLRGSVEADSDDGLGQEDIHTTSHREELVVILSRCYVVDVRSSGGYRFKEECPVAQRACKQNWHLILRPKHKQHRYMEKAQLGEEAHHLDIYSIVTQFLESLGSTESATATPTDYGRLLRDLEWLDGNLEKFKLPILLVTWPFTYNIVRIV